MSILDRLFSRELQRRAGERTIKIYAKNKTDSRKKSQKIGDSALKSSAKSPPKTTPKSPPKSTEQTSLFHRIDVRFPWLKLAALCSIGLIALLDLCDLTISRIGDPYNKIRIAPMAHHVRATDRILDGKMLVALTFDDGPSSATTPRLLDVLTEKDTPATFFMLGNMARNNPDIVKRIKKEGHDIASHTMYHQNLVRITPAVAQADINEAKSVISSIVGHDPSYTRPPYGNINDSVRTAVGTPIILWSVDTLDWQSKNPEAVLATAMSEVHDGAIILMHDIYPTSVDAVPALIDTMRKSGYEFVTISELAKARGAVLTPGAIYYNLRP